MRARRLLILLMMLLLLPQAQAERLTLYTRPNNVDEAMPFQLRPTELSICSVTRAMGGVVVLANDNNYDSLSLYFWQDGMTEMRKLGGGFYWVMSSDTMETAQESCEYAMSRVPNYRMPDLTHAISDLTSDGETLYALNRINGLIFKISETKDGLQTEDVCTMENLSCLNISYRDLETDKVYTYPASLTRMHVCGSVLAISVMQENGIKVVLVDLADGAIREIADESLEAMYEWADGELLLWRLEGSTNEISRSSGTYALSRYSVATGEETLLSTGVPYKKRSECGAYDPYSGSYYDVRTRQIVRTTDFVQEDPVVTFPAANVNIAVTKDSIVGVNLSSVYVRSKENGDMTVLRIQSSNGASNTALQHFAEENPEVILAQETLAKSAMNAASLAARMSASADAPDILRLGLTPDTPEADGSWPLDVLMDKGWCMDLSVYPEVSDYVSRLNGIYRDAVTRDGKIYALPIYAWSYGYFISRNVMEKLGLQESDIPTNLIDLCAFITKWNDNLTGAYAAYTPLEETESYRERVFDLMVRDWIGYCQAENIPLRFDHPVFREMMAALDAMRTDKIEQANQQVNEEISDYRECLIWTDAQAVGNFANYADAFGSRIFLPMALTPDVTTHYGIGYMTVLVVNPRTTNADLVGKLLAQVIADQEATAKCVLLADYDEPIEDSYYLIRVSDYEKTLTELRRQQENAPAWKKQGIQERINEEEASLQRYTVRERWTIAPKTIELYQQTILPMSYLRRPGILADSDAFSALVSQVHQGEISLEEFVEEADKLIERLEQ